jgi:hypothetical protein
LHGGVALVGERFGARFGAGELGAQARGLGLGALCLLDRGRGGAIDHGCLALGIGGGLLCVRQPVARARELGLGLHARGVRFFALLLGLLALGVRPRCGHHRGLALLGRDGRGGLGFAGALVGERLCLLGGAAPALGRLGRDPRLFLELLGVAAPGLRRCDGLGVQALGFGARLLGGALRGLRGRARRGRRGLGGLRRSLGLGLGLARIGQLLLRGAGERVRLGDAAVGLGFARRRHLLDLLGFVARVVRVVARLARRRPRLARLEPRLVRVGPGALLGTAGLRHHLLGARERFVRLGPRPLRVGPRPLRVGPRPGHVALVTVRLRARGLLRRRVPRRHLHDHVVADGLHFIGAGARHPHDDADHRLRPVERVGRHLAHAPAVDVEARGSVFTAQGLRELGVRDVDDDAARPLELVDRERRRATPADRNRGRARIRLAGVDRRDAVPGGLGPGARRPEQQRSRGEHRHDAARRFRDDERDCRH